jgi:hydrogenase nickel incorporation protein HypA/HybF
LRTTSRLAVHELSIALSLLDLVEQEAARHGGGRVTVIHVQLGALCGLVKESLVSAFKLARAGTPLEDADLVVEEVALWAYCLQCECERPVGSVQKMRCSVCDSDVCRLTRGLELELVSLEMEL